MNISSHYSKGAVSIFVVVFTTLLITVVTVSFARLMLREQQRASNNDLSQSAYDAALAGVEDAKRALTKYNQLIANGDPSAPTDLNNCTAVPSLLGISPSNDVAVGSADLQQAYTCVKINLQTNDYIGEASADQTQVIPLKAVGSFNRVRVEWFSRDDVSQSTAVNVPPNVPDSPLSAQASWPRNRPPVLEAQLIQTGSQFSLEQFDSTRTGPNQSNTNTLFLYPKETDAGTHVDFFSDVRYDSDNRPTGAQCHRDITSRFYACSIDITLPGPMGGGSRQNVYLRLTPRYNATHYRVVMLDGATTIRPFDGVQPQVDSTGRANDLFRRVSARIEVGASVPYPEAAVDVSGNFCKVFRVTDRVDDYSSGSITCTP